MTPRGRLFRKYVVVFVGLVTGALLASGAIELYFSYQENKAALVNLQREKAAGAASRIAGFVKEIEQQIGWTTQPQLVAPSAALEQRRVDFLRLLRQVLPITELSHLDASGKEQIRVSRLAMDVLGSQADLSNDPKFREARAGKTYFGPVYFRKESEPYMTIAMPQSGGGVTVAEVNLKFIWDVISQIKIGKAGRAFVVDGAGTLIAHPDISLVLQKTALASLEHVQAALFGKPGAAEVTIARDVQGRRVLTAHSTIDPLGWFLFVEQPLEEAFEPLYASITRAVALVVLGVGLSILASLLLARRMVNPIRALQAGAARIEAGDLAARIDVRTGDELEALADQFNRMTARLQESYATLEHRVVERTRELTEALEQQTATAEILRVISSSPTDVRPVFDAILASATRLCDAHLGALGSFDGERYEHVAHRGASPEFQKWLFGGPRHYDATTGVGRMIRDRTPVHIADVSQEPAYLARNPARVATVEIAGARTFLAVPMLKEDRLVGGIVIYRPDVRPFTDKQIALVQLFANQAVIAIENVRLFKELEARNRDLTTALDQQTATSEILRVISGSPNDLAPVFETICRSSTQLCDAAFGGVARVDGARLTLAAAAGVSPTQREFMNTAFPLPISGAGALGAAIHERRVAHVRDFLAEHGEEDDYVFTAAQPAFGYRSILVVPMLREGEAIGAIFLWRTEVRPFTNNQIDLLTTFADQAVIAIENVRLFKELQERTHALTRSVDELTALGEVGRAVSSTLDLETVLDTIVTRANQLAGTDACSIYEYDEASESFEIRASQNVGNQLAGAQRSTVLRKGEGAVGRLAVTREPIQIPDIAEEGAYQGPLREVLTRTGYRSLLAVPLLQEDRIVGGLVVSRKTPGEFAPDVVDLLKTFATQSTLAIQNARLFREIEEKSRQLEVANRHKSEFLANMSHELRTPLNAIIGFSEVLVERMFGELNDKQDEYLRDIYSSGRHLLSLINDILDLSKIEAGRMELELTTFDLPEAMQNALTLVRGRADAHTITLAMETDEQLGDIVADERKVKQILLNLLSNAVKFTPDGGRIGLSATPANGSIEISVTDSGVGIAPDDQAVIFEEFRQARGDHAGKREGTGLGLALTKKFVELHGGQIWVKSEVGHGSTFTFTLPLTR